MHGFMEREQSEVDVMAAALQGWIESRIGLGLKEVPEVSVSCGAYAAAIEVDGAVLWCSETHGAITAESLIQMYRDECGKRAVFAA